MCFSRLALPARAIHCTVAISRQQSYRSGSANMSRDGITGPAREGQAALPDLRDAGGRNS